MEDDEGDRVRSKLEAYDDRRRNRFYTKVKIVISWGICGVIGWIATSLKPDIANIAFGIGYLFVFATVFWYIFYFPWESYEMEICSHFARASNLIGLGIQEKGKAAERRRRKSADEVGKALRIIARLAVQTTKSDIMEKQMHDRLSTLKTNIEKFVLPRIILGDDLHRMQSILNGLEKFFEEQWGSLGIEHIDETNESITNLGVPSGETRTYTSSLRELIRRKPAIIFLSLVMGFAISSVMIGTICGVLSLDFVEWVKGNVHTFMLVGIAMSAFISQAFARS
ncbi:hypothetical protein MUP77_00080 [Candidatus Bathyarchaeota archaeon]|nr:hypothetical protein [Candidatus Bathyarchaeota archaeon]